MHRSSAEHTEAYSPRTPDDFPRPFGQYRLLRCLGAGMALVYEAEQQDPQRRVALKIPRGGLLLTEEARQRFLREVALAANIDHAGIVPLFDAGEIDGTPFFTMPLVEGLPFDQYLNEHCPTMAEKLTLFQKLCTVVGALHAAELVHRDLKPANVLVDRHGDVRLLDFGLAKASSSSPEVTIGPSVMGTLEYMAPEQTRANSQNVGPPADVYALGVILYHCLTQASPFPDTGDIPARLRAIAEDKPIKPSHWNRAIPASIEALVLRCLSKDPKQRHADAGTLAAALPTTDQLTQNPAKINAHLVLGAGVALICAAVATSLRPSDQQAPSPPSSGPAEAHGAADAAALDPNTSTSPFEAQRYTPMQLRHLSADETSQAQAVTAIPKQLWPLHAQLQRELREDFARRRQGAVILHLPANAIAPRNFQLGPGANGQPYALRPGECLAFYVEGGEAVHLRSDNHKQEITAAHGQVEYRSLWDQPPSALGFRPGKAE